MKDKTDFFLINIFKTNIPTNIIAFMLPRFINPKFVKSIKKVLAFNCIFPISFIFKIIIL